MATGEIGNSVFPARLAIALIQALALYLLAEAATPPLAWPATEKLLFEPLLLVACLVPLLALLGLGQIAWRNLAMWAACATVVVALLGYHDAARGRTPTYVHEEMAWPWFHLALALPVGLFIAQILVIDAINERRLLASYPRQFDTAWKQGVQLLLAVAFTGVFWGILVLGAGLFKMLDIDFFRLLLEKRWFAFPATTLAYAMSIHATDVQPSLIRGARTIGLTLIAWLLPILAAILLGFLCSLPFVSLATLWSTHLASALLLASAAWLIVLINACYQDGAAEQTASRIKRIAATLGALELLPLVGLAIWALALRVGQYGWTVERIEAASVIVVALCYALGYAGAVVRSPTWLKRIEITNFVAACLTLALGLVLFTPIADPARLMVADQWARLKIGIIPPEKFDFVALKFDGARWGVAALTELGQSGEAAVSSPAKLALAQTNRYCCGSDDKQTPTEAEFLEHVAVYPAGRTLPVGFYASSIVPLQGYALPICLRTQTEKCFVRFVALQPGAAEAILFVDRDSAASGHLFEQDAEGKWRETATLNAPFYCKPIREGLEQGTFTLEPHAQPDLMIAGQRLQITPLRQDCPADSPAAAKP